ncbi:hypothetical protein RN96_11570 [Fusobacterium polymorphum]|uniref:Uncharacterized protein n=1 Tax=Fusobacterium nucleatum subsp. polymorphum TaxID=76857 RepID=A0A2B7YG00_FUSNP|nr:hypothetical protein [Fusobacterium polymorphum]PGH20205.1 hypothetical protein RN96_11570 [Fusobacterium polymorphum]
MININNYKFFKNNLSTLKEISKDDSETIVKYMTESILPVVNFDGVKTEYLKSFHLSDELAKSCDGLLCLNDKDIFIEFKNGKSINASEIKIKIKESLLILTAIIAPDEIFEIKNKGVFILVYNKDKNPITKQKIKQKGIQESPSRDFLIRYSLNIGGKEFIRYGLEKFDKFFNEVHTYCQEDFEKYIKQFEI